MYRWGRDRSVRCLSCAALIAIVGWLATAAGCGAPPALPGLPKIHRPAVTACAPMTGDLPCLTDADCHQYAPTATCAAGFCNLDECTRDDQCGSLSTCACRGDVRGSQLTDGFRKCLVGDCRVDADCPGRFCSPSVSPGCGPPLGLYGYYCHTGSDECTNDEDCAIGGAKGYCAYHKDAARWQCGYLLCTP